MLGGALLVREYVNWASNRERFMKRWLCVTWLGLLVGLLAGCDKGPRSPRIVCALDGKIVATSFTFAEFKQTLATEHGQVEATGYEQLMTPSLALCFKPCADGTLLAERVLVRQSGKELPPAVFFGLIKADPDVIRAATTADQATRVPALAPASK